MIPALFLSLALLASAGPGQAVLDRPALEDEALYRVVLSRAAPGRLLDLIEAYREVYGGSDVVGRRPFLLRHSQGDQWDLMLIIPLENDQGLGGFAADPSHDEAWDDLVAWREELIAVGPPADEFDDELSPAGFYHIEIFLALPGKRGALLEQREMENEYLRAVGRRENLIFTRWAGAAWDIFTVGAYRNLQHFAERSDVTAEEEDTAARAAGFEAANRIGTYLRTLIAEHHDTLATRVRLAPEEE